MSKHKIIIESSDEENDTPDIVKEEILNDDSEHEEESTEMDISEMEFKLPNRIMVLGPTESGKTTIIRQCLKHAVKTNKVVAIWWIGESSDEETWLPKKYKRQNISKELLEEIRNGQRNKCMKDCHQIIVLDDVMGEKFRFDDWWEGFISSSRHQNISLIFGMQYIKKLPPVFRENIKQYILTHANDNTVNALRGLSTGYSLPEWREQFKNIKLGHPILFDARPGRQQITHLTVPRCDTI
jgi:GTPase SAR1 family protein